MRAEDRQQRSGKIDGMAMEWNEMESRRRIQKEKKWNKYKSQQHQQRPTSTTTTTG